MRNGRKWGVQQSGSGCGAFACSCAPLSLSWPLLGLLGFAQIPAPVPLAGLAGEPPFTAVLHNKSTGLAHYKPGQRLRPDSVPYPRSNTPLEEAAAVATMLLVFGWALNAPSHF